ncbi:MAG: TVP38/TMEM64 family protein [Candidatus Rokuibacteriota bacterium]|nr:MAG: TVP38/TMEM64 family protein [Candidatus Rokubacteria bacterium]
MSDEGLGRTSRRWRVFGLAALVVGCVALVRQLGVAELLSLEGVGGMRRWMDELGPLGPLAFIAAYIVGVVAFVPSLPMSVLAGLLFGPLWGTLFASVASTLGACLAFMIARYGARDLVEHWVARSPALGRLDHAATRHGFRLVMVTRLVPLFPFNVQNYVYGITGIGFAAYALTSWLCMLPATVAFTMAGGSLGDGGLDIRRIVLWLALAATLVVLLSLLPRWLSWRSTALAELLRSDRR